MKYSPEYLVIHRSLVTLLNPLRQWVPSVTWSLECWSFLCKDYDECGVNIFTPNPVYASFVN